ncbi:MAG: hypothetical protein ABL996_27175, partial [Micropepsaceae bacterium]
LNMAKSRSSDIEIDPSKEPRMVQLMKRERQRVFMSMPRDALRSQLFKAQPGLDVVGVEREIRKIEQLKERDPLAVLQESSLRSGERFELFNMMRVAPNFEMAMYLAQATGACIVTDSYYRWTEIRRAIRHKAAGPSLRLTDLSREIERSKFAFPQNLVDIATFAHDKTVRAYPALFEETIKYLSSLSDGELTPKQEPLLVSRFAKTHAPAQAALKKARIPVKKARISCVFASEGIQDNTVNRLLLMSSSERHLPSVPMAFFIEGIVTE